MKTAKKPEIKRNVQKSGEALHKGLPLTFYYLDHNYQYKLFPFITKATIQEHKQKEAAKNVALMAPNKEQEKPIVNNKENFRKANKRIQKEQELRLNKFRRALTPSEYLAALSIVLRDNVKNPLSRSIIISCLLQRIYNDQRDHGPIYFEQDIGKLAILYEEYSS